MCHEETEEEFYSDDELNQHEAALRREQTLQSSSLASKAVELNKSVIERSKSSDKPSTKLDTPPVSTNLPAKPVEATPAPAPAPAPASVQQENQKPSRPAEVEEKPPVKEPRSLVSGTTAKERWVWAYTKILQVGETTTHNCH